MEDYWPLLEANWGPYQLQARSSCSSPIIPLTVYKYTRLEPPSGLLSPRALLILLSHWLLTRLMELLILCHIFSPEERGRFSSQKCSNPLPAAVIASQRQRLGYLLHQVFIYKYMPSLRYFNSEDALRKKTSKPRIRTEIFDGWEDVERIIKDYLTFLKISKIELSGHFGIEKLSRACYQERTPSLQLLPIPIHKSQLGWDCLCLPMKDTCHDWGGMAYIYRLEGHELRVNPCHAIGWLAERIY